MPKLTRRALGFGAAGLATSVLRRASAEAAHGKKLLMPGTRWETMCHRLDSGRKGPTVMIVAGIHGNETAPPLAATELARHMPKRGALVIVPRVNQPALTRKSRLSPAVKNGDLNRNFPTARRREPRGEMATTLWNETLAAKPDWVLDLHEGWGYRASSESMGSSIVRVADEDTDARTLPAAQMLIETINATIAQPHKKFQIIGPGPAGSYARAVVEQLHTPSFVFETTWVQKSELRVAQQLLLVRAMLARLEM